jgi:hypothetical protein
LKLIDRLFDGPVDVVGDVHGEIDALEALLAALGYEADGRHAAARRLVFVGDLVDRGPDSPAVLQRVMSLVEAGRAQCILGNHELNLLRDVNKHGNDWWVNPDAPREHPARPITAADKTRFHAFLSTLPLALEREDLRVVHASWNANAIERLRREQGEVSVLELYERHLSALLESWRGRGLSAAYRREWQQYGEFVTDPDWKPVVMSTKAQMDSEFQMQNPVVVLTSGEERPTDQPYWAGGRWRMVDRVKWWEHYADPPPVIIGHYWRRFSEAWLTMTDEYGPDLFADLEPHHWMGAANNVYCVDFSVGGRYIERADGASSYHCTLAAVRVPEWRVVQDDGQAFEIGPPGAAQSELSSTSS